MPTTPILPAFSRPHPYADSQPRSASHVLAKLAPEILKIHTAIYTPDIQKHLVDAVMLDVRRQILEVRHDPIRHVSVQGVVAGERDDRLRELRIL